MTPLERGANTTRKKRSTVSGKEAKGGGARGEGKKLRVGGQVGHSLNSTNTSPVEKRRGESRGDCERKPGVGGGWQNGGKNRSIFIKIANP